MGEVERTAVPSVWCCRFLEHREHPYGIGVPGFVGGFTAELCAACEARRLGTDPDPQEGER